MLLEQISKDDMKKYIKQYYNYAKEYLKIDKAPKLKFIEDEKNSDDFLGKTGYYNPENMTIHLYITNRHPKDIVRSFAHELIHHYQNLNEKLPKEIMHKTQEVDYASKDMHLRDMEREAFEKGNMMFRDWTDSLKKNRSLKELKMAKKEKVEFDKNKADVNDNGEVEGWEEARAKAIAKSQKNKNLKDTEETEEQNESLSKTKQRKMQEQSELEATDPRFKQLFTEKERLMNDHKTKREEIIFNELMKRFIK